MTWVVRPDVRTVPFSLICPPRPDWVEIEKESGGTWDRIIEPKNGESQATAAVTRQNIEAGVDTYINVNNHYEGSAPLTIRRLLDILWQESPRRRLRPAADSDGGPGAVLPTGSGRSAIAPNILFISAH
jgi:uncharacterized protein YecE (DUF72 family)